MVIRCSKCGTENPDTATSCSACGMNFNFPIPGYGIAPKKGRKSMCPKCGYVRLPGDTVCPICGHEYPK